VKFILDTNVFVSGIFFSGPPNRILTAWNDGQLALVTSLEILDEYRRVAHELNRQFPSVDINAIIDLAVVNSEIYEPPPLPEPVCADPDDDKFIACAVTSGVQVIVSGDRHLLKVSGYRNIKVLKPRDFVEHYID
jgi:putative PIN family toxin of toxin-antitoxin system